MARQFRTAIESGIPLRSVLEALDEFRGTGKILTMDHVERMISELSKATYGQRPSVYATSVSDRQAPGGVLYGVDIQDVLKPKGAANSQSGSMEIQGSGSTDGILEKFVGQGFDVVVIKQIQELEVDYEKFLININRAEESASKTIMELWEDLDFASVADLHDWLHLGCGWLEAVEPNYFRNPKESLSFGPFLKSGVQMETAIDWVWSWVGYFTGEWSESNLGYADESMLGDPFLLYQHGFTIEQAEYIYNSDHAGDFGWITEFVKEEVPPDEILEWLESEFWGRPEISKSMDDDPRYFLGWRRRGIDIGTARHLKEACEAALSGAEIFKTVDVLQRLGMELRSKNVIAYHGLSSDQILWLVDNGSNTELARTLLRSGLPQERLKAVQASIGNGVDPKVLAQFANQDRFMEAVQSESGPFIVDVMRRLSDEKLPTLVNASLLCLSSHGLSADEIVHWARLTEDRTVVDEWINAGFSPSEALRWAKGGVASPLIARRRSDAGISPPQAASTTQDV